MAVGRGSGENPCRAPAVFEFRALPVTGSPISLVISFADPGRHPPVSAKIYSKQPDALSAGPSLSPAKIPSGFFEVTREDRAVLPITPLDNPAGIS